MKGLHTKTIGELIIMVVVVIILGAASVSALPYIQDLLAQYFGLTVDNAVTEAVECSYLRCAEGCNNAKVQSQAWPNLNRLDGSVKLGNCPCASVPNEFKKNGKICGWDAQQYPVEASVSSDKEFTKLSFPSDARPDCMASQGPNWADLLKIVPNGAGTCSDINVASFKVSGGKFYYVNTGKADNPLGPRWTDYHTYVEDGRKYFFLSASNNYEKDENFIWGNWHRIVVDGISEGMIKAEFGPDGKLNVSTSTAWEAYPFAGNKQYIFKFGDGYLNVVTGPLGGGTGLKISLQYSATSGTPLKLSLEANPQPASQGSTATFTSKVTDDKGSVSNVEVDLEAVSATDPSPILVSIGKCTTDSNGECKVNYPVSLSPGTYQVSASTNLKSLEPSAIAFLNKDAQANPLKITSNMPELGDMDKKISSLVLSPYTRITLFSSKNYGSDGDSMIFESGSSVRAINNLEDITPGTCNNGILKWEGDWNDCARSIKISSTLQSTASYISFTVN